VKVRNYTEVLPDTDLPGVALRTVITAEEAPRFSMRVFEVAVGGSTPLHTHEWEHEVFVLSGSGQVHGDEGERPLSANDVVFVPPGEEHCFTNTGDEIFCFICCIPNPVHSAPADSPSCDG
jgi:quercetin dioxygenase-like cupin family protein